MRFCRRLSVLLLGLSLGATLWSPSARSADEVFEIRGVSVDRTDDTAAAAREAAIADGHLKAIQELWMRIVPDSALLDVPYLTAPQIENFVSDFSVSSERTSRVRYLADLNVRFNAPAIRNFLRSNGIPYAETRSKPALMLPVYGATGEAHLWDDPNPWFRAWAARRQSGALVPLIVPLGDLEDMGSIGAEEAISLDSRRIEAMRERYGAEDVVVSQAILKEATADRDMELVVVTRRDGPTQQGTTFQSFAPKNEETLTALLQRAAAEVFDDVQEAWKQANLLTFEQINTIRLTVETPKLPDWLEIKRRLDQIAAVEQAQVASLSRGRTVVSMTYGGDEQQLIVALSQRDLELERDRRGNWYLWLEGNPPPEIVEARESILFNDPLAPASPGLGPSPADPGLGSPGSPAQRQRTTIITGEDPLDAEDPPDSLEETE